MKTPSKKPSNPNFSSGPTRKPEGWSISKLNLKFLGRYHRSIDVREHIEKIILKIKKTLKIRRIINCFLPGSSTGAMTSIINSILGEKKLRQ